MIGNIIEFHYHDFSARSTDRKPEIITGLVVDAFTKVSGSVSGRSESFLGFGEGTTSGKTDSKRMYKVEFYENWDTHKRIIKYEDIYAWQLVKIISHANSYKPQETNEEKFV